MECNKDEANKARELAEKKFVEKDLMGARKFAMKAESLFPTLDGLQPLLATLNIYIFSQRKINGEIDWYGLLGVDPSCDDETMKKQYRKFALTLHPDKNKSVGAEGAFKILSEAWSLLSDQARRAAYDQKRNSRDAYQKVTPSKPPKPVSKNGIRPSPDNRNVNIRSMSSPNPRSVPPQRDTFWTVCTSCKMQFEYALFYLNKKLQCYSCKEPFMAIQISHPQTNSSTKGMSFASTTLATRQARNPGDVGSVPSPHENSKKIHDHVQVSTLEDVMRSRISAFKRANTGEAYGPCSTMKSENPQKRRRANEQKMNNSDEVAPGGEAGSFVYSNGAQIGITRELTLLETRSMLMSKAKVEIHKKLNEWKTKGKVTVLKNSNNDVVNGVEHVGNKHDVCFQDNYPEEKLKTSSPSSSVDCETQASDLSLSMTVPDPDFHDFDKDRNENSFGDNQVWAAYDNDDGMPRYYAIIHHVVSRKPFKMRISWLNSKSNVEFGPMNWVGCGFYKTNGDFRVGRHEINESINSFSHKVKWTKVPKGAIRIHPSKGDTWALYKNWSPGWNEHTTDNVVHRYNMVEVLDDYKLGEGYNGHSTCEGCWFQDRIPQAYGSGKSYGNFKRRDVQILPSSSFVFAYWSRIFYCPKGLLGARPCSYTSGTASGDR